MRKTNQTPLQKKNSAPCKKVAKTNMQKTTFAEKQLLQTRKQNPLRKQRCKKKRKIHLLEKNIPFKETNSFLQTKNIFF